MKKVTTGFFIAVLCAFAGFSAPSSANAANYYYNGSYISEQQLRIVLIAQIQQLLAQLGSLNGSGGTVINGGSGGTISGASDVDVETVSARSIDDDRAQLVGELDLNNEDFAYVWFEYGTSNGNLSSKTGEARIDDNDPTRFLYNLTGLRENRTYYYRAYAEDERGRVASGNTRSFVTDGDYDDFNDNDDDDDYDDNDFRDDKPDVETNNADNVKNSSAILRGEIDMNDYDNGLAFFVYGEDENQVEDIEREYREFRDIDEDGDDLQAVEVGDNLDDDDKEDYDLTLTGLDDNTDYYYAMCLQFENDSNDEVIICGNTEDFETDN